jgi:Tfp pilus assembly protein PilO
LSNIETELRAIKNTITQGFTQLLKNIEQLTIDSTLKFNLANMKYHDEVIKKALEKLPFDTVEK